MAPRHRETAPVPTNVVHPRLQAEEAREKGKGGLAKTVALLKSTSAPPRVRSDEVQPAILIEEEAAEAKKAELLGRGPERRERVPLDDVHPAHAADERVLRLERQARRAAAAVAHEERRRAVASAAAASGRFHGRGKSGTTAGAAAAAVTALVVAPTSAVGGALALSAAAVGGTVMTVAVAVEVLVRALLDPESIVESDLVDAATVARAYPEVRTLVLARDRAATPEQLAAARARYNDVLRGVSAADMDVVETLRASGIVTDVLKGQRIADDLSARAAAPGALDAALPVVGGAPAQPMSAGALTFDVLRRGVLMFGVITSVFGPAVGEGGFPRLFGADPMR